MFASNTAFATGDIKAKVTQWGLWSRGDGLGAAALRQGAGVSPDITDEEGLLFDKLVSRLRCVDERACYVICGHYQIGKSFVEMSVELKVQPQAVRIYHKNALHWLDGCFDAFCLLGIESANDVVAALMSEVG